MTEERNWNDPVYKKLRIDVLKRDSFSCQWPHCGSKQRVYVHHIRKWSTHPELRFVVGNCISLCRTHHDFVWGREEDYETLFYSIIYRSKYDKRSRQQSKARTVTKHPKRKKKKNTQKTYAEKYATAKAKARARKRRGRK